MKKPRKILFPTDFSDASANAFVYALELAKQWNASIEVLHVIYPQVEGMDYPVLVSRATKDLLDTGREVLKVFVKVGIKKVSKETAEPIAVLSNIEVGIPERIIKETVQRNSVDMIIMGSRGENRSGIDKWIGSTAADVAKGASCPVIVVPENTKYKDIKAVAYASDSQSADSFEIWESLKILEPIMPKVHIVHVNLDDDGDPVAWEKMEEVKASLIGHSPKLQVDFHHIVGDSLEDSLNEFVDTHAIDLLIMYHPKYGLWDRLFHRSKSKKMAIHSHVPLLVQKES